MPPSGEKNPKDALSADDEKNSNRIGGLYERSHWARGAENWKAFDTKEYRYPDQIEKNFGLEILAKKYPKEFEVAEERQKEKPDPHGFATWWNQDVWYDFANDKTYEVWLQDKKEAKEIAHIHWVDEFMDDFWHSLKHAARVGSSVGILVGLGKSLQLWRKVDKVYTRLHGVTFYGITAEECAKNVCYGFGYSFLWTWCMFSGDALYKLFYSAKTGKVSRVHRDGNSLFMAGCVAGAVTPLPYVFYLGTAAPMYKVLLWLMSVGLNSYGMHYVGYEVYDPHRATYGVHDERPWVPWHKKELTNWPLASMNVRGRYT